jgi:hypothetical protein
VKVTSELSRRSVEFFKASAKARRVSYQRTIRALVDAYAEKQKGSEGAVCSRVSRRRDRTAGIDQTAH